MDSRLVWEGSRASLLRFWSTLTSEVSKTKDVLLGGTAGARRDLFLDKGRMRGSKQEVVEILQEKEEVSMRREGVVGLGSQLARLCALVRWWLKVRGVRS